MTENLEAIKVLIVKISHNIQGFSIQKEEQDICLALSH